MNDTLDIAILDRFSPGVEEEDLLAHMAVGGAAARWIDFESLTFIAGDDRLRVNGEPMPLPHLALVRSRVFTRATDLTVVFDALTMLEHAHVRVLNAPAGIQRAHNKVLAAHVLAQARLPVPATQLVRSTEEAGRCLLEWDDVVFKPAHGHSKAGLARLHLEPGADAPDTPPGVTVYQEIQLWHMIRSWNALCGQRFIPNDGRDVRVLVVEDRVVACNRRRVLFSMLEGAGSHRGYDVEATTCTPEIADIAARATRELGLQHSAVDMVEGPDGLSILEVNPMISIWRDLDARGLHLTDRGVGSAFADSLLAALQPA